MGEQLHITHRDDYGRGQRDGYGAARTRDRYRPRDAATGTQDAQHAYGLGYADGYGTGIEEAGRQRVALLNAAAMLRHGVRVLPPCGEGIVSRVTVSAPAALAFSYWVDVIEVKPDTDAGPGCCIACHGFHPTSADCPALGGGFSAAAKRKERLTIQLSTDILPGRNPPSRFRARVLHVRSLAR